MKKAIICALLLCVFLSACGQADSQVLQNNSQTTTVPGTVPTVGNSPTSMQTDEFIAVSFDEYSEFINLHKAELPDCFVPYEQFSNLGSFYGFYYYPNTLPEGNNVGFVYEIATNDGGILTLQIGYEGAAWTKFYREQIGTDFSNYYTGELRKVAMFGEVKNSCLEIKGVKYIYVWDKLLSITWVHEGNRYALSYSVKPSTFDDASIENQPEFVRNLLHTDTVETAMQSFKASMESAAAVK